MVGRLEIERIARGSHVANYDGEVLCDLFSGGSKKIVINGVKRRCDGRIESSKGGGMESTVTNNIGEVY